MKDIQNEPDSRGVAIKKVGISKCQLPFSLKDKRAGTQMTVGEWKVSVKLKHDARGTHMSRFMEVLQQHRPAQISLNYLQTIVKPQIKTALGAQKAEIEVSFTYFIWKETPVTHKDCDLPVYCRFVVSDYHKPVLEVKTPITTLCPCSKEISIHGAHNQRSWVTIQVISQAWLWIEDLVLIAEEAASCPIWPLLKRPDEKYVTEKAFDSPRFVEDVVREVALGIRRIAPKYNITWYKVICENEESIHVHNAFAEHEEDIELKPWQKAVMAPGQTKVDEHADMSKVSPQRQ